MATAELAAALPIVVVLLAVALGAVTAVRTQLRCEDAAYTGARLAARGSKDAVRVAAEHAPAGASVTVTREGAQVKVVVATPVSMLGSHLPAVTVNAVAVSDVEPGAG